MYNGRIMERNIGMFSNWNSFEAEMTRELAGEVKSKPEWLHTPVYDTIRGHIYALIDTGEWNNTIEDNLRYIARNHGAIHVERYLENRTSPYAQKISDPNPPPEFDFTQYDEYVIKAYRQFGRRVGDDFGRSFPFVISQGLEPQMYFEHIAEAVKNGGKLFAARFARNLPPILNHDATTVDFRRASEHVRESHGLKFASKFMNSADDVLTSTDYSLDQAVSIADVSHHHLGKDIAPFVYPQILFLAAHGDYPPESFIDDVLAVEELTNRTGAKWFATALAELGDSYQRIKKEEDRTYTFREDRIEAHTPRKTSDPEVRERLSPKLLQQSFLNVQRTLGNTGAMYFARHYDSWNIQSIENTLLDAEMVLGGKLTKSILWHLNSINYFRKSSQEKFDELFVLFSATDEETVKRTVAYTAGAHRKRSNIDLSDHLILPPDIPITDDLLQLYPGLEEERERMRSSNNGEADWDNVDHYDENLPF